MSYRKDFPIFKNNKNLVYLDTAATSQKPKVVIETVNNFYNSYYSNVHRGLYSISQKAEDKYEETRDKVRKFINARDKSEIIFTGGATEAINLAAFGYFQQRLKRGDMIVLSEMEHHSNIVPWLELKKRIGFKIYYLKIDKNYNLNYQEFLNSKIDFNKVKLISLTHASNVLGTVNPLEVIIPKLKRKCSKSLVLVDAAQSIPHIKIDVKKLHCEFLAFSSHKMFGPSGVGVLYANTEILNQMDPIFYGSHMISSVTKENVIYSDSPEQFEAGTGKLEAVIGMGAAIDYMNLLGINNIQKYEKELSRYIISKLLNIKNLRLYTDTRKTNNLPVFSFNIDGIHPHDLAEILNRDKICIRAGHHCAQVLMGSLEVTSTARVSLSIYNNKKDIDKLCLSIEKANKIFKL